MTVANFTIVNGKKLYHDSKEYKEWSAKRAEMTGGIESILASRKAPGGHEPYWGVGHEGIALAVPKSQIEERNELNRQYGVTGVEHCLDDQGRSVVKYSSPRAKAKYEALHGYGNATAAKGERIGGGDDADYQNSKTPRTYG